MAQPEKPVTFTLGPWADIIDLLFPDGVRGERWPHLVNHVGTVTAITTKTPTITVSWP